MLPQHTASKKEENCFQRMLFFSQPSTNNYTVLDGSFKDFLKSILFP